MTASRRNFMGRLALGAAASVAAAAPARAAPTALDFAALSKDTDVACVYHCDFGDQARFGQMLNNIANHLSVYDFDPMRLKIVVVAHGPGLKFFLGELAGTPWASQTVDPELYARFTGLSKYGVEAYLCRITFERLKIDPAKARGDGFLKLVPSGVATVAELQSKGYSYLKVA
ncbi:DsrE family protein [Rhodoplanes sp. TEM]|uniref:DsrE family protein n=1 Tax=Rhodoplanes tepidamans TaxID=200616 RepID=A0ABT5JCM9_RHOTP|nr:MULTISPECIES: DsrE family protein [Rhodoplanes]MDC7787252.1 DsrE family protein [Rhodoplanes tepidamans]MDC7985280.1 DsrE family protein [Rhodoplanes sp. TEM]MDQ0357787.1 intracellular sulfur oxidation DsrE/DsrF family protein [Rhodoplanes tepidamans]